MAQWPPLRNAERAYLKWLLEQEHESADVLVKLLWQAIGGFLAQRDGYAAVIRWPSGHTHLYGPYWRKAEAEQDAIAFCSAFNQKGQESKFKAGAMILKGATALKPKEDGK